MEFNATFLVSAISFVIFVFIMNAIFYKPLEKIITEREKLVSDTLNDAKNTREKSAKLIQEREEKLTKVAIESKEYIAKNLEKANKKAKVQLSNSKNDSFKKIANEKSNIEKEKEEAAKILDKHIQNLANDIVKKVTE